MVFWVLVESSISLNMVVEGVRVVLLSISFHKACSLFWYPSSISLTYDPISIISATIDFMYMLKITYYNYKGSMNERSE